MPMMLMMVSQVNWLIAQIEMIQGQMTKRGPVGLMDKIEIFKAIPLRMRGKDNTGKQRTRVFVQRWWHLFLPGLSSVLNLCLFSHKRRVMQHMIYDCSSTRTLICLKERSSQAFIGSSACKCTNILLLFHLINLNLGKLGNQKRMHFL